MMDLCGSGPLFTEGLEWDIYLWSRAAGIYGGTAQIQRNIVAQRVLGLPRA
jgi:alkylation response protein AidB-like acyl-CoA dehydrogenase